MGSSRDTAAGEGSASWTDPGLWDGALSSACPAVHRAPRDTG